MRLEEFVAGDTLDFIVEVPDYPASDGWTLKYRLTPQFTTPAQVAIPITASPNADGKRYNIQVPPATTTAWAAGKYTWARWVEKSGARQTLDESGQLTIHDDPALTVAGFDSRSHARKVLDAIKAVLESRATSPQRELVGFTIGSRSQQLDQSETKLLLLQFKSKYEWMVFNEENAAGIARGEPNQKLIRVRFGQS